MSKIKCPVCECESCVETKIVGANSDSMFIPSEIKKHKFYQCMECLCHFWNPFFEFYDPATNDLQKQYDKLYLEYDCGFFFIHRNAMLIDQFLQNKHNVKVLDIGGGNGVLGDFLKFLNPKIEYTNIEPQKKSFFFSEPINGFFPDAINDDELFDVIHFSEVIEHIVDFRKFVKNIYKHLKPNGIFFLTTPNALEIKNEDVYSRISAAGYGQHQVIFTPRQLQELFGCNGKVFLSEGKTGHSRIIFTNFDDAKMPTSKQVTHQQFLYFKNIFETKDHLKIVAANRIIEVLVNDGHYHQAIPYIDFLETNKSLYDQYEDEVKILASDYFDFYKFIDGTNCALPSLLYFKGILETNFRQNHEKAMTFFTAASFLQKFRDKKMVFFSANSNLVNVANKSFEHASKRGTI